MNLQNPDEPGRLLRERLRSPLPVEQIAVESLQDALAQVRQEMVPLAGVPVSELLLDPRTDPAALTALKNHLKNQARLLQPGPEYDTALALYYAAIASALVFHNRKITTHTDAALARALGFLKNQPWMAGELAELFGKAIFGLARSVGK
jgi:plasmid maintenance system antidote protein VapI